MPCVGGSRLSLGLEAGLPDRATPTGDAGAPGKGLDLVCRGGGAAVAVTRPGPAGAGGSLHGSADGGRMAGGVRGCHGGSGRGADPRGGGGGGGGEGRGPGGGPV